MRAVREKRNAAIVSDTGAPRIAAEETPSAANGTGTRPSERTTPLPAEGDDAADARCTGAPAAPFSPLRSRAETSASRGVRFDGTNFYQAVKPQIDELFVRYPAEERLNAIVPNSKWVRVETDADHLLRRAGKTLPAPSPRDRGRRGVAPPCGGFARRVLGDLSVRRRRQMRDLNRAGALCPHTPAT